MNQVVLMGRLTKDPEVKTGNDSTIARYTLAVDRRTKDKKADFINCVSFGKGAEFAQKYLHKGTKIVITGHIQTGSYAKQDGTKVYTTDVVIDSQEFAESKGSESKPAETTPAATDDFVAIPDGIDEELPFV